MNFKKTFWLAAEVNQIVVPTASPDGFYGKY
ncbi:MAG: hypothetical protein ACI9JR_002839 [Gammaproteobacteria bacterium]|jgi:hypothetical protein